MLQALGTNGLMLHVPYCQCMSLMYSYNIFPEIIQIKIEQENAQHPFCLSDDFKKCIPPARYSTCMREEKRWKVLDQISHKFN